MQSYKFINNKLLTLFFFLFISSCNFDTRNIYFAENFPIKSGGWNYSDKAYFNVNLKNSEEKFKLYIDVRNTNDYKYSNLYLKLSIRNPDNKWDKRILNIPMAERNGKWIGSGTGSIYSNRVYAGDDFDFSIAGSYYIEIDQYMRDNNLHGIADIGLRLVKLH